MTWVRNTANVIGVLWLIGLVGTQSSCSCSEESVECNYNNDCNATNGEICVDGKCRVPNSESPDTGSDDLVDSESETASVPGTASDTGETDTFHSTVSTDSGSDFDSDSGSDSDSNNRDSCTSNSHCDDGNPCTADYCNTEQVPFLCAAMPRVDGLPCVGDNLCSGKAFCESGECVAENPPCKPVVSEEPCVRYEATCDAENSPICTYISVMMNEDEPCHNGDPCMQGVCRSGACVDEVNPCSGAGNACTAIACQTTGTELGNYSCAYSLAPDGNPCMLNASDSLCYASDASPDSIAGYCVDNGTTSDCIVPETRKCYDNQTPNICEAFVCVADDASCSPVLPVDVSIAVSCEETVTLMASDFITRDYYRYTGGQCDDFDVRGKEVAITLDVAPASAVAFEVINDGGQDISLHHLSDMCDPASCMKNAFDSLSLSQMHATDAVIVEAGIGYPPGQIQISVTCSDSVN